MGRTEARESKDKHISIAAFRRRLSLRCKAGVSKAVRKLGRKGPQSQIHVFPPQKLVYVEVPKAGCTSIKYALKSHRGEWAGASDEAFHKWFGYTFVASTLLEESLRSSFSDWTKMTVVRNPYERFLSLYSDKLMRGEPPKTLDAVLDRFSESRWYSDPHGRPQLDLVGGDPTIYDFVGRTEKMDDVFRFLSQVFREPVEPLHENRTPVESRRTLSRRHREKVYRLYRRDFVALGYPQ